MSKPSVLFACVENSNRSQMAEAFANMHGGPPQTDWCERRQRCGAW